VDGKGEKKKERKPVRWIHTFEEAPRTLVELIDWQQILGRFTEDTDYY
jgi:hypothetical protein